MTLAEIPAGGDLLELCQAWQRIISDHSSDPAAQDALGREAVEDMRAVPDFHGSRKVIVDGDSALMLPDGTSREETLWPALSFKDVVVAGELGKTSYVRLNENALITWVLYNSLVITTYDVPEGLIEDGDVDLLFTYYLPVDRPVPRALYFPVGLINHALCAV